MHIHATEGERERERDINKKRFAQQEARARLVGAGHKPLVWVAT